MSSTTFLRAATYLVAWSLAGDRIIVEGAEPVIATLIPKEILSPESVEQASQGWTSAIMSEPYRPPTGSRFVAIPRTGDDECDYVRLSYSSRGDDLIVTMTSCMFSVEVKRKSWAEAGALSVEAVQECARTIFEGATSLRVLKGADVEGRSEGGIVPGSFDGQKAPWLSDLSWRQDNGRIVFWFLKLKSGPSKQRLGKSLALNRQWFSPVDKLQK